MARSRVGLAGTCAAVLALLVAACGSAPQPPNDAELFRPALRQAGASEQFYFVMTDRFANGDPGNDTGGLTGDRMTTGFDPTDKGFYHGGDLRGVTGKLDYIAGLGTTAIWLTPTFANKPVQGVGAEASASYHGYWTTDFTRIDPHLGTNADMKALIDAAHARGIKVYFDIIVNHTADVIAYEGGSTGYVSTVQRPYRDSAGAEFDLAAVQASGTWPALDAATFAPYKPVFAADADRTVKVPAWLNDPTMYHNRGNSTWAGESSLLGDFVGLDDLFTERPEVVRGFEEIYGTWVELGIDGFRLDTVKHVDLPFWQAFSPAIMTKAASVTRTLNRPGDQAQGAFFMFGEVYETNPTDLAVYTTRGRVPAVLDFAFQTKAMSWVNGGSADTFLGLLDGDDSYTDADSSALSLPTFLGNHDMGRVGHFLAAGTGEEGLNRAKLAHSLMFLTRGQPVVYYGDEQGLVGAGGDRDARQDMFATRVASYAAEPVIGAASGSRDRYDPTHPLYVHLAALAKLRADHPALASGSMTPAKAYGGLLAFTRWLPGDPDEYVVVLNNGDKPSSASVELPGAGRTLTPVFGASAPVTSDATGAFGPTVPAYGVAVYRTPKVAAAGGELSLVVPNGETLHDGDALRAQWDGAANGQVSFSIRPVGAREWIWIGTDDNPSWTVTPDLSGYKAGTKLEVRASGRAADGTVTGASMTVTLA